MKISLPIEKSFDCPAGIHSGVFYEHRTKTKQTEGGIDTYIRLIFKIPDKSTEQRLVLVARNFIPTLDKGSELRTLLDSWLGPDFVAAHGYRGKFDFDTLNGLPARLVVRHIENEGHRKPFVYVEAAFPPGSLSNLQRTEEEEEP